MSSLFRETLTIASEQDLVRTRTRVREEAVRLGFKIVDQTKLVTAASEIARNALVYGGGGTVTLDVIAAPGGRTKLELTFEDDGPGIPDVEAAMTDGFTSGSGLGLGLGGTRRLVDDFELVSAPGTGTRIRIARSV